MQVDKSFDLKILEDKVLFQKIAKQKDLFIEILSELGNHFPVQKLSPIHPEIKSCGISKGNQLDNCPYQVLDLIRDFNLESGFNIRILNWWGHGLMVLILYGSQTAVLFKKPIEILLNNYSPVRLNSPWDYESMLVSSSKTEELDLKNHLLEFGHLQLLKFMRLTESYTNTLDLLKMEISFIIDIHQQSLPY